MNTGPLQIVSKCSGGERLIYIIMLAPTTAGDSYHTAIQN